LIRLGAVLRRHGNADARVHGELMAAQLAGLLDRIVDPLHQIRDIGRIGHRGLHDRKLVAAQPRHDVGFPETPSQPGRHGLEQFVAALVSEGVVDALEFVEVQIEHRQPFAASDTPERLLELFAEKHPVGQVGQRIVVRQMRDPLFGQLSFRDILDHGQEILRLTIDASDDEFFRRDGAQAFAPRLKRIFRKGQGAGLQELLVVLGDQLGRRRRKDLGLGHCLSEDLFARTAKMLGGCQIDQDISLGACIPDRNRGRHAVDDLLQELTVAISFPLQTLSLGHVLDDAHQ
jgi:hypothetical protein